MRVPEQHIKGGKRNRKNIFIYIYKNCALTTKRAGGVTFSSAGASGHQRKRIHFHQFDHFPISKIIEFSFMFSFPFFSLRFFTNCFWYCPQTFLNRFPSVLMEFPPFTIKRVIYSHVHSSRMIPFWDNNLQVGWLAMVWSATAPRGDREALKDSNQDLRRW